MPKDSLKSHLPLILTSILTAVMILVVIITSFIRAPLNLPSPGVIYDYSPGISVKTLAHQLVQAEVIQHPTLFEWYVRFNGYDKTLQAGEYYFHQGINIRGLVYMMRKGLVIKRALRVQEGWNIHDLIALMQANPLIQQTIDYTNPEWFKAIDPNMIHPEGQFMPETYSYPKGISDLKLFKIMHKDLKQFLSQAWEGRATDLPYQTPYQALIAASIIEKETGIEKERAMISGVIVRRLAKNMRLQMDPTVIYGLGNSYTGQISKKDLLSPTPYNTYTIMGLPPTPIALPSKQSIEAAMHPAPGTSLYFVANGDGSHTFSDTLEQHNTAVGHFLKATQP